MEAAPGPVSPMEIGLAHSLHALVSMYSWQLYTTLGRLAQQIMYMPKNLKTASCGPVLTDIYRNVAELYRGRLQCIIMLCQIGGLF